MPEFNCTACGACCLPIYDQISFCSIDGADLMHIPRKYHKHVHLFGDEPWALGTKMIEPRVGPLKGIRLCACVFLRGQPLHRTRCAIYKQRPITCHVAAKPGDEHCREWLARVQELLH